ncbi:MAG: hypothetical protein ACRD4C_02545 [Candidatus Acidiferrales bacterium]
MQHVPLSYRIKLLLFFLSALAVLVLMDFGYSALDTLSRLDVVEAQRDQWQRPAVVIDALDLKPATKWLTSGVAPDISRRNCPGGLARRAV